MIANTGLQVYDAINEDSKLPNIEYPDTDASKAIIEFHACKYQAIICLMVWSFKSFLSVFGIWNTTNKHPSRSRTELFGDWPVPEVVNIYRVFQPNAMCHRAKKIVHPSPSYGKGPRVHGLTTSWLSCQQTDSDQWCIIHIFNLNPVHLDLGNELHR